MAVDPSYNVHQELLPHIHLISAYRYPLVPRFGIPDVTEWLLNASRIAREGAPFFWTYLDAPQDGTILLTWQPLQRMGTEYATDGYVWPRGEVYYQHEIRDGLILEVFHQTVGFRPGEEFATHSRRRFRLMPPKVPNPNAPQVDPSLWLVHYGPIDEREPPLVKKVRIDTRLRTLIEHRNSLLRAGQITRKDFMLSDRVNWPQIPLPRDGRGPTMYSGGIGPGGIPQQMAYPAHHAAPGSMPPQPPSKRPRHHAGSSAAAAQVQAHHTHMQAQAQAQAAAAAAATGSALDVAIYEDEEDTSRGDLFDAITPRDVSLERYKQNHEWMEELISSPYRMGQIGYADLGLGRKGELAAVTDGIFESQGFDAFQRAPKKPYVGRLDGDLADAFRKRVKEKMDATHAEIAAMQARHAKIVRNFHLNSVIKKAEKDLRVPADDSGSSGNDDDNQKPPRKTVDETVAQVERTLGRKVVVSGAVVRVQDGGYREPSPEPVLAPVPGGLDLVPEPLPENILLGVPTISTTLVPGQGGPVAGGPSGAAPAAPSPAGSQLSGIMIGDADMDMGDTAAGMLDQMESVFSPAASTPGHFLAAHGPGGAAAAGAGGMQPSPLSNAVQSASAGAAAAGAGAGNRGPAPASGPAPHTGSAGGDGSGDDWVVVPPGGGVSPVGAGGPTATSGSGSGNAPATLALPAGTAAAGAAGSNTAGSGDFGALDDLDTTGDALASLDEALDLDMEDSAFGDAFHGSGAD